MTTTAEKPYPLGLTYLYRPYKGVPPGRGGGVATLLRPNAPLLRSKNVSITNSIHYKNTCAIYGLVYKSFISLLGSPPPFAGLLNFPRSRAPIRQPCVTHSALRTRNIWLLLVFLIHKHSISLQLFRNETSLLKYVLIIFSGGSRP